MDFQTKLLIGGRLVEGEGAGIGVENPATEETVATSNLDQLFEGARVAV